MARKIGLNVVMTFPWCLGFGGLHRAIKLSRLAGYDGLQILPLRGWSAGDFEGVDPERIIAMEDAWNHGPFLSALARQAGLIGEPAPLFHDWLLFGPSGKTIADRLALMRSIFPDAIFPAHKPSGTDPIEMHPEAGLSIKEYAERPYGLVWDTAHVLRMGRHDEAPVTNDWRKLFAQVSGNIRLIHVKDGADPEMLKALAEVTDCPVILETRPPIKVIINQLSLIDWLEKKRRVIRHFFKA